MGGLFLLFLVLVVALFLFIAWLVWGLGGRMTRPLAERHVWLQEIAESGQPPAAWLLPYQAKLTRLARDPDGQDKVMRVRQEARAACIKRLTGLVEYLQRTTLVDSEATRDSLLSQLRTVQQGWIETRDSDFI